MSITDWNPVRELRPPEQPEAYTDLYPHYLELYSATRDIAHALAVRQLR